MINRLLFICMLLICQLSTSFSYRFITLKDSYMQIGVMYTDTNHDRHRQMFHSSSTQTTSQEKANQWIASPDYNRIAPKIIPYKPSTAYIPVNIPQQQQQQQRSIDDEEFTLQAFHGLKGDWKRRLPNYKSDWIDGFNRKSLSATIFLYFACLAPTIAFGGIANSITNGQMGVIQFMLSTGASGMIYALFSGQPMTFIGPTGLTLAFMATLYRYTQLHALPFLAVYAWVGLWTSAFLAASSVFNLASLIKYSTRFTDDSFNAVLAMNFIYEAFQSLMSNFLSTTSSAEAALVSGFASLNMALATWLSTKTLVNMNQSTIFNSSIRKFFSDFGATISILLMSAIATLPSIRRFGISFLTLPQVKFSLAGALSSMPKLLSVPWSVRLLAIIPAVLLTMLFYLDHNISIRAVNSFSMKKGEGYHIDLLVLSGIVALQSLTGLPWTCAATVQSLNHVRAMSNSNGPTTSAKPAAKPKTSSTAIVETRVTGFAIHGLILASTALLPVIAKIPLPVISGIFIFLGERMTQTNLFLKRVKDLFHEKTSSSSVKLPAATVGRYVAIQSAALALVWYLKQSKKFSLLFPGCIAMLIMMRWKLLPRWFQPSELAVLDPAI
jgi:hypothetical protein